MKKILYIVLDGLGDRPHPDFDNKTPLEAANKPNLDDLAQRGKCGLVYTVGEGIAPESDIAVISILGYDARKYYTGRGPLESFAEGLDVRDGDLAWRVNFATVGGGRDIIDRRVGRNLTTEEASHLSDELNKRVKLKAFPTTFKFKNTVGHRGVLVIHPTSGRLSGWVTNSDPAYEREGVFGVAKEEFDKVYLDVKPMEGHESYEEAINSSLVTNEFIEKSRQVLEKSGINKRRRKEGKMPANLILARDAGDSLPRFPKLNDTYGIKFGCFVEMPVERGIALLTGMEVVELPLPSGDFKADYKLRADKVLEAMDNYDALYIHIKGPDEPAHDGDFRGKVASIEAIDEYFFGNLLSRLSLLDEAVIAVTADHSTPCTLKAHSDDPVPILIAGANVTQDKVHIFSENSCRHGRIGTIGGGQILPLLIEISRR